MNIDFRAVKDLHGVAIGFFRFTLHELADHRQIQLADEVSHEDKAVLHHTDHVYRLSLKIGGDAARHFLYPFFDLLCRQENSRELL